MRHSVRDSCCLIEFICEHYLTFSKSLLRVILCLLCQRKNFGEILKTKEFLTEGKGELENANGSEHESIFTFKMAFLECFQTVFYHKQSRALLCLQDKGVAQSVSENLGFHNDYDHEYEKVFITFWTLHTNFYDFRAC